MFCPKCGSQVGDKDQYCRQCGAALTDATQTPTKKTEPESVQHFDQNTNNPEMFALVKNRAWVCPSCGGINPEINIVCRDCAQRVRHSEQTKIFPPLLSEPSGQNITPQKHIYSCTKCGVVYMTQLTTCPKCGGDVSDIVDVSPTQAIKADAKHGNCADQSPPSSVPPVTKGSGKWWEGISWHYVVFGVLCLLFPQLLGRIEAAATSHIVIGLGVVILVTILTLEVVAGKKKG